MALSSVSDAAVSAAAAPSTGFTIVPSYDASLTNLNNDGNAADQAIYNGYTRAVATAIKFYETVIKTPITVTIDFGWGETGGTPVTGGLATGSWKTGYYQDWPTLYAALQTKYANGSAVQQAALATLSATDPSGVPDKYVVGEAQMKALGLSLPYGGDDGEVGLNAQDGGLFAWSQASVAAGQYDAVGVLEHEIAHSLGRIDAGNADGNYPGRTDYELYDLFHYAAADGLATDAIGAKAGARDIAGSMPGVSNYFSYDGKTVTLPFDGPVNVQDGADWASSIESDSYGYGDPGSVMKVSATDLQVMNALGFAASPLIDIYDNPSQTSGAFVADSAGDLFKLNQAQYSNGNGALVELASNGAGLYSASSLPASADKLWIDSTGDLFGETLSSVAAGNASIFELAKSGNGYASTPVTLLSYSPTSSAEDVDAAGDVFVRTSSGGLYGFGAVIELPRVGSAYTSPVTLLNFADSTLQASSVTVDSSGDVFLSTAGTTSNYYQGSIWELPKATSGSYATALAKIGQVMFFSGLSSDKQGDLFATTAYGGTNGDGTVFEFVKTSNGYAAPTALATFSDGYGEGPTGSVLIDAAGDVFGTTDTGSVNKEGTVFEIVKTASGYNNTPTILATFDASTGSDPFGLVVDKAGDVFGSTHTGGTNGSGEIFEVANSGFQTGVAATQVPADFNGDGASDILFQNVNGTIDGWLMNGLSLSSSGVIANPTTAWTAVATGDFNGDGKSDILYQNQDGTIDIWQMNGLGIATTGIVANPGTSWHGIATGDFDGDGKSDILFQNNDGTIDLWMMNGAAMVSSGIVANPGTAWHAIGTGDFNGDGKSDILFQNDNGNIDVWEMNGLTLSASGIVANPSPAWRAVGTGDFNGDGKSDIVLQNKDGTVAIWTMNGLSMTSSTIVADPGPAWHAIAVGDYNGDGKSDILFQNDDGTVDAWLMNGTTLASSGSIANPTAAWQAIGLGSMHFIDGTQSTGTLTGTILADNFVFTTSQPGAHIISGFDPLHDVISLDQTKFGTYAAVQAAERTVNGSTLITLGTNNTLTITGVLPGALGAKNFV